MTLTQDKTDDGYIDDMSDSSPLCSEKRSTWWTGGRTWARHQDLENLRSQAAKSNWSEADIVTSDIMTLSQGRTLRDQCEGCCCCCCWESQCGGSRGTYKPRSVIAGQVTGAGRARRLAKDEALAILTGPHGTQGIFPQHDGGERVKLANLGRRL